MVEINLREHIKKLIKKIKSFSKRDKGLIIFCIIFSFLFFLNPPTIRVDTLAIHGIVLAIVFGLFGLALTSYIFQVQSIETQIQTFENFTLDYIFKICEFAYPQWSAELEEHVEK